MKRAGSVLLTIPLISTVASAQAYKGQGRIDGVVTDEQGSPLEGVKIKLCLEKVQSGFDTESDKNGEWKAWWIRGGTWKIDFEKISDPTVLYNIGSNFYSGQKYEDALKYCQRAVEIKDDFLDGLYQLGLVHLTLGNYQDSIQVFEGYLQKDPDSECSFQVKNFIEFLKTKIKE